VAEQAGDSRSGCDGGGHGTTDCDEAVRELYSFLDGELTEERRYEISVHLDECGPCAEAAGFEAELRVVIASRCRDRVPESLIERVAATLEAEEVRRRAPGAP
jgi:mycothiol system anti-sigma-R factor